MLCEKLFSGLSYRKMLFIYFVNKQHTSRKYSLSSEKATAAGMKEIPRAF